MFLLTKALTHLTILSSFLSKEGEKKSSIQYITWLLGTIINKSFIACCYPKKDWLISNKLKLLRVKNKFRSDDILQRGNTIPTVVKWRNHGDVQFSTWRHSGVSWTSISFSFWFKSLISIGLLKRTVKRR